jgi:general secretion pathway protein N
VIPAFALVLLGAGVILTPLRMALGWLDADRAGLSAREVDGTLWDGRLQDASFRGLPLGDPRVALAPRRGGLHIVASDLLRGEGVFRPAEGLDVSALNARLPLDALAGGLPFKGELALTGGAVQIREGRCRTARGEVRISDLALPAGALTGLVLSGRLSCREGRLSVPLTGQAGGVAVDALMQVDAAGDYRLETRLRAGDPAAGALAGAAGFQRGLDGYRRVDVGRLGRT